MTSSEAVYRQVPVGTSAEDAVTVGIENDKDGRLKAAVWWSAKGDVDADEAEFAEVGEALAAAEAARALHGFAEVVITLADPGLWRAEWGRLQADEPAKEPIGDLRGTDISDSEAFALARDIETERDA
jgi:hypothetical protein